MRGILGAGGISLLLLSAGQIPAAASTAYFFCYPVSPAEVGGSIGRVTCPVSPITPAETSSYYYNAQGFLEYNSQFQKYHLGDDWNGNLGGSTDKGDPVFAVAEGVALYARDLGNGSAHSWGKVVVLKHTLPGGTAVYSLYAHLDSILVPSICNTSSSPVCLIDEGEQVGTIGDGNGYYEGIAHLHFEIRKRFELFNQDIIPGPGYIADPTNPFVEENYYDPTQFIEAWRGGTCVAPGTSGAEFLQRACTPGDSPTVSTSSASGTTQSSATLNMSVNPNGLSTSAWFRWGTSQSSLNTTTNSVDAGSGTIAVSRSATISGLSCNTTYYFQALAHNSQGQASGATLSFRTDACGSSGGTDTTDLIRNGTFAADSAYWTRWGDFYADRRFSNYHNGPGYAYLSLSDGSPGNNLVGAIYQQVAIPSNAQSASLTYWLSITTWEPSGGPAEDVLNATVQNSSGGYLETIGVFSNLHASSGYVRRQFSMADFIGDTVRIHFLGTTNNDGQPTVFRIDDVSLDVEVPESDPPDVTTGSADQIGSSNVRLNMTVNPNGADTTVWFNLEPNDSTPNDDTPHFSVGSGTQTENVSYTAGNLDCDTLYYFRANADNAEGSREGSVRSFRTLECSGSPPSVDTDPAESITQTSARLTAEINPNGLATQAWFEWGASASLGTTTPRENLAVTNQFEDVTWTLNGLECGTTYYFNAFAENSRGSDDGAIHSFTTSACDPPPTNTPPTITVTEPNGFADTADQSYLIEWTDSDPDPDDNATVTLYRSSTNTCAAPVLIVGGIPEDDSADSYLWNTVSLPEGAYYVRATINDGMNPPVSSCSSGPVTIEHPSGSALIFSDGFESGNTSRWSQAVLPAPPSSGVLFSDDFEAQDSSPYTIMPFGSNQHTFSWQFTTDGTSVLELTGGTVSGGGDSIAYVTNLSEPDVSVSVRLKVEEIRNGGHHSGLVARFDPSTITFYELWLNVYQGFLRLSKRTNLQEVALATPTVSVGAQEWVTLRLDVEGSRLKGSLDGELLIDIEDSDFATGYVGMTNSGSVTRFDSFLVTAMPGLSASFSDGNGVTESGGILYIDRTVTDAGGWE